MGVQIDDDDEDDKKDEIKVEIMPTNDSENIWGYKRIPNE